MRDNPTPDSTWQDICLWFAEEDDNRAELFRAIASGSYKGGTSWDDLSPEARAVRANQLALEREKVAAQWRLRSYRPPAA